MEPKTKKTRKHKEEVKTKEKKSKKPKSSKDTTETKTTSTDNQNDVKKPKSVKKVKEKTDSDAKPKKTKKKLKKRKSLQKINLKDSLQPDAREDLEVIEKLKSKYDIGSTIGEGVMSVVKKGKNKKNNEDVAIKILQHKDVAQQHHKFLENEIEILLTVSHPNIIELKEILNTGPELYLIMELATGGMLFDRIIEKGSYTEKDAKIVVTNILSAIQYLHSKNIVHRDLKPDNLLLKSPTDDYSVKIADFGLSKIMNEETLMLTACGTPSYVAPEVIEASGYGKSVDLWAVGLISYILLCGFPPFVADTVPLLLEKIMSAEFDFDEDYWGDVSAEAKDFVSHLLVADPDERFSAEDALGHKWIKSELKGKVKPLVSAVQANMKHTVQEWRQATKG